GPRARSRLLRRDPELPEHAARHALLGRLMRRAMERRTRSDAATILARAASLVVALAVASDAAATGIITHTLTDPELGPSSEGGMSVAIVDGKIAVGAPGFRTGNCSGRGAVSLFDPTNGAKLRSE